MFVKITEEMIERAKKRRKIEIIILRIIFPLPISRKKKGTSSVF